MFSWFLASIAFATPPDLDGDGYPGNNDCNDLDAAIHPGAAEIVGDNIDQNCDGHASCYRDSDDDGARTSATFSSTDTDCNDAGEGKGADPLDCDDGDAAVHPGASETVADGIDQNCDGDESCYLDSDKDGSRSSTVVTSTDLDCKDAGEAVASDPIDCNDSNATVHPGATEVVGDDIDQTCDGKEKCYVDGDDDGSRTNAVITSSDADCRDPNEAKASDSIDCNDANAAVHPGAAEKVGDNIDQNCDGAETCYKDGDGDGARSGLTVLSSDADCKDPLEALATAAVDCDDKDDTVYPGATEVVGDGVDENCDGGEQCFADLDDDGTRSPALVVGSSDADCNDPYEGRSADLVDCADNDPTIHPGASEVAGDEVDQDCNGGEQCFGDADADGARTEDLVPSADPDCADAGEARASAALDCDDSDPISFPGAVEIVGNEVDNDCNGGELCWADADDDGSRSEALTVPSADPDCSDPTEGVTGDPIDCDEGSASVHPGATELVGDGVDQDCDGVEICFRDVDGDGAHGSETTPGSTLSCTGPNEADATSDVDCDDADPDVSPTASELCDGLDNDCDSVVDFAGCDPDDLDHDGLANADDEALCAAYGVDPSDCPENPDLDQDAVLDGIEAGPDLANPLDTDGDGTPDFADADDEEDGVGSEFENGIPCGSQRTATFDVAKEYWVFACGTTVYDFGGNDLADYPDHDLDGIPDFRDLDDDGDGVDTVVEGSADDDCDLVANYLDADDTDGPCVQGGDTGILTSGTDGTDTDPGTLVGTDTGLDGTDPGTDATDPDPGATDPGDGTEPPTVPAFDTGVEGKSGCGCSTGGGAGGVWSLAVLLPLVLRRRR